MFDVGEYIALKINCSYKYRYNLNGTKPYTKKVSRPWVYTLLRIPILSFPLFCYFCLQKPKEWEDFFEDDSLEVHMDELLEKEDLLGDLLSEYLLSNRFVNDIGYNLYKKLLQEKAEEIFEKCDHDGYHLGVNDYCPTCIYRGYRLKSGNEAIQDLFT